MALLRSLRRSPTGLVGAIICAVLVFTAVAAPLIAPHSPTEHNLRARFQAPAWAEGGDRRYLLGTDQLGRDILSRVMYGSRIAVIVGLSAVVVSLTLGMVAGMLAGFLGGLADTLVMRIADGFLSIPMILLVISIAGIVEANLLTLILILGVTGWVAYSRVVRSEVLSIREMPYIEAVQALGQRRLKVLWRHVTPNILSSVIVLATLEVARVIIAESTLSFLGVGVKPPTVTWGLMLADGREHIGASWWMVTFPGIAISVSVLGIVMLGDWLRDVLDPRLQAGMR